MNLLPTPQAMDTAGSMDDRRSTSGYGPALRDITALLPTPAVNDMGASYDVERWEAWTARMKAEHGNGNGHGNSLHIEALRMLPTPTSTDHKASGATYAATDTHHTGTTLTDATVRNPEINPDRSTREDTTEGRPGEVLPDVRSSDGAEEVRERATRGPGRVPPQGSLFAGLREREARGDEGCAALASAEASSGLVHGVRDGGAAARTPHRPEPGEQRAVEPDDAVRLVPPAAPLAGGPGQAPCGCAAWANYAPAIHRWEHVLGRRAPLPTEPTGKNGAHRLSARAVEFMMGLPDGWVTDTDTTRNEQLKALGNGVVPQQAAAAVRHLLGIREMALTREAVA